MSRYYFHLRARGAIHLDPDGTELSDVAAAREHASAVAQELMRHSAAGIRHWSIRIENERGEHVLDLLFPEADPRLSSFAPAMRLLVIEASRRLAALTDVMCAARATRLEARILLARARGKPYLAYARRR